MIHAASDGSLTLLEQFLDWGADINAQDMHSWHPTALISDAFAVHLATVRFILGQGVSVDIVGSRWNYALSAAAASGKIEVMEYLLNQGADPNVHDHILHWAVIGGIEAVALLIEKGADLQVQGSHALRAAFRTGNLDIAKLLLEKGVSPQDEEGSILQNACRWGHLEIVSLLIKNGADVNALGGYYGTALLIAIWGTKSEVVKFLIESGADVNARATFMGTPLSPLQLAIQEGHTEIEEILRRHGA
ncbi:ankyrin repeat-containing protein, partial [Mycena floridula]